MLKIEYVAQVEENRIRITLPDRNFNHAYALNKLACADMFLIYPTVQNVFILPKQGLSQDGTGWMRSTFRTQMGDSFSSRFLK